MYGAPAAHGMRPVPPSAGTAKTLILIALILQVVASVFIALIALFIGSLFVAAGLGGVGLLVAVIAVVVLFVSYLAYAYSYRPVEEGRYEDARTPTLILGILGLVFGGIVVGILYIVAWDKLGDAVRELQAPPMVPMGYMPVGVPMVPAASPYPPAPGPPAAPVVSCPRCHNPGTWVPQYGRYYCYHCQQYV